LPSAASWPARNGIGPSRPLREPRGAVLAALGGYELALLSVAVASASRVAAEGPGFILERIPANLGDEAEHLFVLTIRESLGGNKSAELGMAGSTNRRILHQGPPRLGGKATIMTRSRSSPPERAAASDAWVHRLVGGLGVLLHGSRRCAVRDAARTRWRGRVMP
jgi:hypothetical protein